MARILHYLALVILTVLQEVQRNLPKFGGWLAASVMGEVVALGFGGLPLRVAVRLLRLIMAL